MNADGSDLDLDDLLERELRRRVGSLRGPSPEVRQAAYRTGRATGGKTMPLLSSLAAAASSKAAVGLATAALVIGGGSAAAAVATDSTDPGTWGKTVTDAVASCKSQLGDGEHRIGQCVSAVAKQNGQAHRAANAASSARENEPHHTPSPHPQGTDRAHPAPAGTPHPGGRPTDVRAAPASPPASEGGHPTRPPVTPPTPSPRHQ
jgi:hypothetical protein